MGDKKVFTPMEHLNIGEFNRGQSSKLIRNLVEKDNTAFILKNGKNKQIKKICKNKKNN